MLNFIINSETSSSKTGPIPVIYWGRTLAAARESCAAAACAQWARGTCYAQAGTPAMGHSSASGASGAPSPLESLEAYAGRRLSAARRAARYVRAGFNGNGSTAVSVEQAEKLRAAAARIGLGWISYDHANPSQLSEAARDWWRRWSLLSCDNLRQAAARIRAGYRVSVVVRQPGRFHYVDDTDGAILWDTERGAPADSVESAAGRIPICPAQLRPVKLRAAGRSWGHGRAGVDCNTCGHCESVGHTAGRGSDPHSPAARAAVSVAFIAHEAKARRSLVSSLGGGK
jgi:hypothetical protein